MYKIGDLVTTSHSRVSAPVSRPHPLSGFQSKIGIITNEYLNEDDIDMIDIFWQDGKKEEIYPWDIRFLKKV